MLDGQIHCSDRPNLKESEKMDKYLESDRDMRKLWDVKVTVVPLVMRALGLAYEKG